MKLLPYDWDTTAFLDRAHYMLFSRGNMHPYKTIR